MTHNRNAVLNHITSLLPRAMIADRIAAIRHLQRIKKLESSGAISMEKALENRRPILARLERSVEKKNWRRQNIPSLSYPESLPITAKSGEIIEAIQKHAAVIISGDTGSGKTTQIPKFCLAAGRGTGGFIGCTQPRRLAATTVSHRIAEELGEPIGRSVGYKIRFKDKTHDNTLVKIMTDGILLAESQIDPFLNTYDTIIVDEAHERSLNIDFILGILKLLLDKRRDLKLIVTSATIDTKKFSRAFNNAPVIEVSGRMYPVETRYFSNPVQSEGNGDSSYVESAVQAVEKIERQTPFGDVLIFMPTEQDILETCELIEGRKFKNVALFPLFSRLSAVEQKRVFSRPPGRKIIVATNVAETSITIPGIKYVVDSGLARISQYNPRLRITALPVLPISQSSADQRKGRCGRVENGVCIRIYSEEDYISRPRYTQPEILRSNLAEVILRMLFLRLGNVETFPFIDRPDARSIRAGFNLLLELGAIQRSVAKRVGKDRKSPENNAAKFSLDQFKLTAVGKFMARLPLDPRLSRMIFEAHQLGCLHEIVIIASALAIQDPRERPLEKHQEADKAHEAFTDSRSDFISLLNIWEHYQSEMQANRSLGQLKKYCQRHFLSFKRMREWQDIHSQILLILKDHRLSIRQSDPATRLSSRKKYDRLYAAIHKSVLSGFLSNIAQKVEKQYFRAAGDKAVMVFPGSGLFKNPGAWIVAAEFVETTRLFARTVAAIEKEWLESYGKDLCRRTYLNPFWNKKRGEVTAEEQVSLFGLIIVAKRPVSYGRVNPEAATDIFIRSALVQGEISPPFAFLTHNQQLIEEIKTVENRLRRKDILIDEEAMFLFYKERLDQVFDISTLKRRIQEKKGDHFLKLAKKDLQRYEPAAHELRQFPNKVNLGNRLFECLYDFEPGKETDGITVRIPAVKAGAVDTASLEWIVPGHTKARIAHLLKSLPKHYRKQLMPLADTQEIILREMPMKRGTLATSLSRFLYDRLGIDIPAAAWPIASLPDHLKIRYAITDKQGRTLRSARDPSILKTIEEIDKDIEEFESLSASWGKTNVQDWDFGDLPEQVRLTDKNNMEWEAFPALVAESNAIDLKLFLEKDKAAAAHKKGVQALLMRCFSKDLKHLKTNLSLPKTLETAAQYFGGIARVESTLFQSVLDDIFLRNIRTQNEFMATRNTVAQKGLHRYGGDRLEAVKQVLQAHHSLRTELYRLETANRGNHRILEFLTQRRADLSKLLPENFIALYDNERLSHLLRYARALEIRTQRGVVNLEKDLLREKQLLEVHQMLERFVGELSPSASADKREAVETFYWMLEEYKISIFAQEVKTAGKISKKMLLEKCKEIERMV